MSGGGGNSARRNAILSRVRSSLGVKAGDDKTRILRVAERLESPHRHTIPSIAMGDAHTLRTGFIDSLESAQATTASIGSIDDLPQAVNDYLKAHNLPQRIRMGEDAFLTGADWSRTPHLERKLGAAEETDQVGLAAAFAGIAETGTLMLTSGSDNPTTNNFLPADHIVVVPASKLYGSYEDGWDAWRARSKPGEMPRTVNYVSGPSRTGDIEQTLLLGAHGPCRLHVIVVEDA